MIEVANTRPRIDVQTAEYLRLLGYPRDWVLEGRAADLANASRDWYARHGRPWVYSRQAESLEIVGDSVCIDGVPFASARLQTMLTEAGAESVVLVAASAGGELESQAQRLWREDKPDEYFFLEVYGSAVVEHLITMKGAELCAWAESCDQAILPHYSPGYPEWKIAEQPALLDLIRCRGDEPLPGKLETLDSGMLRPKKSLLAVFGLTSHRDRVNRLTDLSPCESCWFLPCQYRRAPYQRASRRSNPEEIVETKRLLSQLLPDPAVLNRAARYSVNTKALARWAQNRLSLTQQENGDFHASFRYEGTTCSNLGQPLHFDYQVTLGPREEGYVISTLMCRPAPGYDGYTSMCRYRDAATSLMSAIEREKPLLGEPLNRVTDWELPNSAAGCYCELSDRMHKWRLVLETIHFALVERERTCELASSKPESTL